MTKETRTTLQFIGITFFLCWTLAGIFALSGGEWQSREGIPIALVYMVMPGLVALYVQRYLAREPLRETLAIQVRPNRWFLAAWILPAAISLLSIGTALLMPGVQYSPDLSGFFQRYAHIFSPDQIAQMRANMEKAPIPVFWTGLLNGLIAGITVNALFALGEELGWRGLLVHRLSILGFWRMAGVIGLIWGIWHAPIILMGHNYPEHPIPGVFMMVGFTLLLTPLLLYIRLRSGSTIAAAVFHGTVNGLAGLSLLVLAGGNDLTVGMTGLAGFAAIALVTLAVALADHFIASEPLMWKRKESGAGSRGPE